MYMCGVMWCLYFKVLLIGLSLILSQLSQLYYSWKFSWELNFVDFMIYKKIGYKKNYGDDTLIYEILNPRRFPDIGRTNI